MPKIREADNGELSVAQYTGLEALPISSGSREAKYITTETIGLASLKPWSKITGTPTTLAGYGIVDAAPLSHTQPFSTITSTPTTLSGYGIVDALVKSGVSGGQVAIGGTGASDALVFIGTSGAGSGNTIGMQLKTGSNGSVSALTVLNDGRVGVGTTAPGTMLHVKASAGTAGLGVTIEDAWSMFDLTQYQPSGKYAGVILGHSRGTVASPSETQAGDYLSYIRFNGRGATGTVTGAVIYAGAVSNFSDTNAESYLILSTTPNGSTVTQERMRVASDGKVGIGATAPSALLDVNSDVIRLRTAKTPASATAAGNAGDICWDSSFVYVCVATNTWKRAAIATW